ncbi:MAG: hypothetical protein VX257_02710, partial [Planctomycetota bacterium]|nr:hypothetical protein [Planctomycetota bacterium]
GQLEAAAVRRYESQAAELLLVFFQNRGRQTDGLWFVVSLGAVAQTDVHINSPVFRGLYSSGQALLIHNRSPLPSAEGSKKGALTLTLFGKG